MITVIAHYRTAPGVEDTVRELLARHSLASEAEPGCLHFIAHQDSEDPSRFALYEGYTNQEAFEVHRKSEHFRVNIEQTLVPLLVEREWRSYGPPLKPAPPVDSASS